VAKVMTTAAFPALARVQGDRQRLRAGFLQANRYVALTCMPIMVGAAVTASVLVPVVFGDEWSPAARSLQLLALSGPALLVTFLSGSLYRAIGRPQLGLLRTALSVAFYIPAFIIGAQHGINGVAAGFTIASYLVLPFDLFLSARAVDVGVGRLLANVAPAVAATLAMAGVSAAVGVGLRHGGDEVRLGAMVVAGAASYALAALILMRETVRQAVRDVTGRAR
jgi:O-antigen/teichoic acid export membrane protein